MVDYVVWNIEYLIHSPAFMSALQEIPSFSYGLLERFLYQACGINEEKASSD